MVIYIYSIKIYNLILLHYLSSSSSHENGFLIHRPHHLPHHLPHNFPKTFHGRGMEKNGRRGPMWKSPSERFNSSPRGYQGNDKERVQSCVCYSPISGKLPRWVS